LKLFNAVFLSLKIRQNSGVKRFLLILRLVLTLYFFVMRSIDNSRREFIRKGIASSALLSAGLSNPLLAGNMASSETTVLNPRNRVPVSFIIDDSTALVNMAYYGIPQFKEVFPNQYLQDWKKPPSDVMKLIINWSSSNIHVNVCRSERKSRIITVLSFQVNTAH